MIECASLENNHLFEGNPLAAQHRLRFKSIIQRQKWEVPIVRNMEFDSYDNPATVYLIKRDAQGEALAVSRLYPTDRPYMLKDVFSPMVTYEDAPSRADTWEGSRFCVDETLSTAERRLAIQEIVIGYLEFGMKQGIDRFVGLMYPAYWRNIFTKSGWDIEWMGDEVKLDSGHAVRAGGVRVSQANLDKVRRITGIHEPVLTYGNMNRIHNNEDSSQGAA